MSSKPDAPIAGASVSVRDARPADYEAVGRLTVAAYRADGQLDGETGYEPVLADVGARAAGNHVFVAVDDVTGQVLGAVTFVLPGSRYAELSRDGEAEFRMLAVDPGAQRRGVARLLVRACLERAASLGCSSMVICTRDFAASAHRLYTSLGFVRQPDLDWSPVEGVQLLGLRCDLRALALPPSE